MNFHNLRTGYPQLQNAPKLSGASAAFDIPHAVSSSVPRGERMRTMITMSVATTVAETAAPADPLGSDFCGPSGTVLSRPPVSEGGQDAAGKLYHIHTFGCQVSFGWMSGRVHLKFDLKSTARWHAGQASGTRNPI